MLYKTVEDKDKQGVHGVSQNIDAATEKTRTLPVAGSIDWFVVNTGSEILFLWGSVPVVPNGVYGPPNNSGKPHLDNVPFSFQSDYEHTRNIMDFQAPPLV